MLNIIDYIEQNQEVMLDWMMEFFGDKYTREQLYQNTYGSGRISGSGIRNGTVQLADEFNSLPDREVDTIKNWYGETDFYIFDLLPYNGGYMFKEKCDEVISLIKRFDAKTVIDFGGGIGVMAIYLRQNTDCKIYYADIKDGVTYRFAKFLMGKFGIDDIGMFGDAELFASDVKADLLLATDCFEHIPNMEETFSNLTNLSYRIYHDSTFYTDAIFPQHVYTPNHLEFLNMCAMHNYLPSEGSPKLLNRVYLHIDPTGQLKIVPV
jgi:hypothetical protein